MDHTIQCIAIRMVVFIPFFSVSVFFDTDKEKPTEPEAGTSTGKKKKKRFFGPARQKYLKDDERRWR